MPTHSNIERSLGVVIGKLDGIEDRLGRQDESRAALHRRVDMEDLIARFGEDHSSMHDDLKPHFFCSECREAGKPDRNIAFTLHIKNASAPPDRVPYLR